MSIPANESNNENPLRSDAPFEEKSNNSTFIGFITSGFVGGVILILFHVPPLAPSLFFGSAVSALVHHYLGGIRPSDASITTGIGRLGGTLASLVLTTMIFNAALQKQMVKIDLTIAPRQNDLVILERDEGKPVELTVDGKVGLLNTTKSIHLQVNQAALESIKRLCREGAGFCKEANQNAEFTINQKLKKGFARICQERHDLDAYPFMIYREGKGEKVARITAFSDLECAPTTDGILKMEISPEDAEEANIRSGDAGFASMPSLRVTRPTSIYNNGI
jgi:hypothetical protein